MVSSLGQVGLCLWMTQAKQLNPNQTYFPLQSVSESKLITSGQSPAEKGFLHVLVGLASVPHCSQRVASVGHSLTPAPLGCCKSTAT